MTDGIVDDLAVIDEAWDLLQGRVAAHNWRHVPTSRVRNQVTALIVGPSNRDLGDMAATVMALAIERDALAALILVAAEKIKRLGGSQR
jgi:hypothetical protein